MNRLVPGIVSTLLVLGCAGTPEQPSQPFKAIGELQSRSSSAAFDENSVIGPRVSMYRGAEGRWTGRVRGRVVDAYEVKNGIRGADFALYFEKVADGKIVRGRWGYDTVYVHLPDDFRERERFGYHVTGAANDDIPPLPQFLFAVMGTL